MSRPETFGITLIKTEASSDLRIAKD